jgi:L-ribulokinase
MMETYAIGVDFGSLSARAAIFSVKDGHLAATFEHLYPHGIMSDILPASGAALPPASALQDPADFLEALEKSVKGAMAQGNLQPEQIVALALDFTSCTLLALDDEMEPLCFDSAFRDNIHAYAKMWKQHTATAEAEHITETAEKGQPGVFDRYGGKILSEWGIPKILETLRKAPEVYAATARFMEAGDWLTYKLTGEESMSYCSAGFKFMWKYGEGYPDGDFFAQFDEGLRSLEEKLIPVHRILSLDSCAGVLNAEGARLTGLLEGTPLAPMRIDGHSSAVAVGCHLPGHLDMIVGTSMGLILQSEQEVTFPGICGVGYGAICPGYYGYEAGLSSCGDLFEWFSKNCVPAECQAAAQAAGVSILQYLSDLAGKLQPGASGLLAVDWWNGNRSLLADTDLGGMIFGLSLQSKPEEILRALFEATGFSARMVIDAFDDHGVPVDVISAVGGIAEKNPVLMQLYADIFNREIVVPEVKQACALGSAIFAATAAGSAQGGYDSIEEAAAHMARTEGARYLHNPQNTKIYDTLYEEFKRLHDYFGRGENDVLKKLNALRNRGTEHEN